jgi:DNA-binding IclR family transcriptional regulator
VTASHVDAPRGIADPPPARPQLGPLFSLEERDGPAPRLQYPGPVEDVRGDRERRLRGQLGRVYRVIRDGEWRTLAQIAAKADAPPASVSAQLRHLRKSRYGGFVVERRHRGRVLSVGDVARETPYRRDTVIAALEELVSAGVAERLRARFHRAGAWRDAVGYRAPRSGEARRQTQEEK